MKRSRLAPRPVRFGSRLALCTAAASTALAGCIVDARVVEHVPPGPPLEKVDLLFVIDNSNSMRENQMHLLEQVRPIVEQLTNPPDRDGDGVPDRAPVRDLHVAVVDTDLGVAGVNLPGCAAPETGDDGFMNPIRYGAAMAMHQPWTTAPTDFPRPADCTDPNQFGPFLSYVAGTTDIAQFSHDLSCAGAIYVNGCGLEQPLEAAYRALVTRRAAASATEALTNSGFVRDDAVLAIVMVTDEEDGSVRTCDRAEPGVSCTDARDVYEAPSTQWSSMDLNMRMYMYQPGSSQDPTWPLDRYVDPHNLTRGLLSLKPGHPERIVFAAVTGVPLNIPTRTDGSTNWDALLGAPASDHDDFAHRDSSTAFDDPNAAEGPVSMRQANLDHLCTGASRVFPACRREGTTSIPGACTPDQQYFAWPARRIVEIARRFDESALCSGHACNNGIVASICSNDLTSAAQQVADRVTRQLGPVAY